VFASSPAYNLAIYEQPVEAVVKATVAMILGREPKETQYFPATAIALGSA
jgi:hypothetical protein